VTRAPLTRETLRALMRELARALPRGRSGRVYLVGGGTAVWAGWRTSTVDVEVFSKIVRGFERDLRDAESFVASGMVDPMRLLDLVRAIPPQAYARYPALSRDAVASAIESFVAGLSRP
jgi:hypothetical protein